MVAEALVLGKLADLRATGLPFGFRSADRLRNGCLLCLVLSAGSESFRVCQIWASTTRRRTGRRSASRRRFGSFVRVGC
jgi:hypothetical protein